MTRLTRKFSFLTAAFPHGAYQSQGFNQPDLRGPSIRGQLRWWYDALFENKVEEDKLFGGLKIKRQGRKPAAEASRIIVRIKPVANYRAKSMDFIPHKGKEGGIKNAIPAGAVYEITLSSCREGLTDDESRCLEQIVDAWLLLGAIGQRANRGAGSIWPDGAPASAEVYMARAKALLHGSKLRCALLERRYLKEYDLRYTAGDFIDGPVKSERRGPFDVKITVSWWPFGAAEDRKPSPLKLRAAILDGQLRLIALWDSRHHTADDLRKGVEQLAKQKEIGSLLKSVLGELCD